jgi:hypothetical protein
MTNTTSASPTSRIADVAQRVREFFSIRPAGMMALSTSNPLMPSLEFVCVAMMCAAKMVEFWNIIRVQKKEFQS